MAEQPITDERGVTTHPSWGLVSTARTTGNHQIVFDSEIEHGTTIALRIHTCSRRRDNMRSWNYPEKQVVEVRMSEAQWAQMISSMNNGTGTPCTIEFIQGIGHIEPAPLDHAEATLHAADLKRYLVKMAQGMEELVGACVALEAVATPSKKARADLTKQAQGVVRDLTQNMPHIEKSLREAMETVVAHAKADFEAYAMHVLTAQGISMGDDAIPQMLEEGK